MSDADEELTPSEQKQVVRLFYGLYLLSLLLVLAVLVAIVYSGFERWDWFVVVPFGAVLMFASRVAKRYTRNLLDSAMAQFGQLKEPIEAPPRRRTRVTHVRSQVPVVALAMLVVSGLWYSIGLSIRWAVGD